MDKDKANLYLKVAWAIAKGNISMPPYQALAELRRIHRRLAESKFWWQRKRVEKIIHYFKKVNRIYP